MIASFSSGDDNTCQRILNELKTMKRVGWETIQKIIIQESSLEDTRAFASRIAEF